MPKTIFKGIIPLFLFLILISFSFAYETYPNQNYNNNKAGNGLFLGTSVTAGTIDLTYSTVQGSIANRHTPVFADIDNDGVIETVYMDDKDLNIVSETQALYSFDLDIWGSGQDLEPSNIVLANMDNDENIEINLVIGSRDNANFNTIWSLEWNGSNLINDFQDNFSSVVNDKVGRLALTCGGKECLVQFLEGTSYGSLRTLGYNITAGRTSNVIVKALTTGIKYCIPEGQSGLYGDFDEDNVGEFLVSSASATAGGYIERYEVTAGGLLALEQTATITDDGWATGTMTCIGTNENEFFDGSISQPIAYDLFGDAKDEIFISFLKGGDDGVLVALDSKSLVELEQYPEDILGFTDTIRANDVSMPFQMNIDSGDDEICVLFINDDENKFNLLCGYDKGYRDFVEIEWDKPYNITQPNFDKPIISYGHSVEVKLQDDSRDELLTAWGIYEFDNDEGVRVFNPYDNGYLLPIIDDNNAYFDLYEMTAEGMRYYEDGLNNENCIENECLTSIEICPDMIDGIAKINETLRIRTTFEDAENDDITHTTYIYYGEDNQQEVSTTTASGIPITILSLELNQTTASSIMRIEYYDSENPTYVNVWENYMTVQDTGLLFSSGDCYTATPSAEVVTEDEVTDDEGIIELNPLKSYTDLGTEVFGFSGTIIWLLLMLLIPIVALVMLFTTGQFNSSNLMGVGMITAFIELFMVIYGVYSGYLGIGFIVTVVIISIAIIWAFMRHHFTGVGG